jgi:hypothetical protein
MRKALLFCRNSIDIFAYAYPLSSDAAEKKHKQEDVFTYLRTDLDNGYTLVGNFQDLQNVNYTQKDYLQRLTACLSWKTVFVTNIDQYAYKAFVLSASPIKLFDRKKKDLSRDYWGKVPDVPLLNNTGDQNVAILAAGQLTEAVAYYDAIYNLTDIWDTQYHIEFHDYRKLLRAIEFVGTSYAQVYQSQYNTTVTNVLGLVDTAYDTFGDLNDLITEYAYYVQNGNQDKAAQLKTQIIANWATLKQWMTTKDFRNQLATILQEIIAN